MSIYKAWWTAGCAGGLTPALHDVIYAFPCVTCSPFFRSVSVAHCQQIRSTQLVQEISKTPYNLKSHNLDGSMREKKRSNFMLCINSPSSPKTPDISVPAFCFIHVLIKKDNLCYKLDDSQRLQIIFVLSIMETKFRPVRFPSLI